MKRSVALRSRALSSACRSSRLFERPHDILACDDSHQVPIRSDDGKAARLQVHHELQRSCQRGGWLDLDYRKSNVGFSR